jgi:hypothetical protein
MQQDIQDYLMDRASIDREADKAALEDKDLAQPPLWVPENCKVVFSHRMTMFHIFFRQLAFLSPV